MLALLTERRFAPLLVVLFLGAFNDNMLKFAVITFAAFHTGGDKTADVIVSLAGAMLVAPWLLFSALAGQLADKYPKPMLVRHVKIAEVGIMAFALTAMLFNQLELMVLALFLSGVQSTMFAPLKFGLLPQYLSPEELVGGNGLVQATTCLAILLGTAVCGQLMTVQHGIGLTGSAMVLVALVGWVASMSMPTAPAGCPQLSIRFNPWRESMNILRLAHHDHPGCTWNLLAIGWFWMAGSYYLAILPLFLRDVLRGGQMDLAVLFIGFAIGAGTGALLCERLTRRYHGMTLSQVGAVGIGIVSVAVYISGLAASETMGLQRTGLAATAVELALIGMCGGLYVVPLYARLQRRSAPANCARILAATGIIDAGFGIIAGILAAGLAWSLRELGFSLSHALLVFIFLHTIAMVMLWRHRPTA